MSCFGGGDDDQKEQVRQNKAINDQLKKDKDVYKSTHRLLLLGEWYNIIITSKCLAVIVRMRIKFVILFLLRMT